MTKNVQESQTAVVEVARDNSVDKEEIVTLSSGVRVKIGSVTASLIDRVTSKIKDPDPPMFMNEDKGREEPNYSDPKYRRQLAEAERERGIAAMDAIVMFGFELVDGLPEDTRWKRKLQLLDISIPDDADDIELEFLYKKYVAVAPDEVGLVTERSGLTEEEIRAAEASFRSET